MVDLCEAVDYSSIAVAAAATAAATDAQVDAMANKNGAPLAREKHQDNVDPNDEQQRHLSSAF